MTQYNSLNLKLSNSQLNKLKSAIKNESEVVLRLSSNMIGNSDDKTNFPHNGPFTHNGPITLLSLYPIKYLYECFVPYGSFLETNILLTSMSLILFIFLFL